MHPASSPPSASLTGVRVLDLSRVLAGPYCAQMLADHGAHVIKIEPPGGDETRALGPPFVGDSAAYYYGLNRNKQAIALDLGRPEARDVLLRLLDNTDVLVENFLPGTMEKWGLGYEAVLRERFPRLVHCRVSGFGADGPLGGLPGYDAVLQAMGGVMSINGEASTGATRVGMPVVDIVTGLHAALGVMFALAERARSGLGQFIDVCLYDTALSLLIPHASNWFASGRVPGLIGSAHPNIAPYDKFVVADGEVFLGVVNDTQFRKFAEAVGQAQWATDPRFASNAARLGHRAELKAAIESVLATRKAEPLCRMLMAAGVPAGPVHTIAQALDHPHTAHRGMRVEVDGARMLGVPVQLSRTPGAVRSAPPAFAADAHAVLREAGYGEAEIDALIAGGAVTLQRGSGRVPTSQQGPSNPPQGDKP